MILFPVECRCCRQNRLTVVLLQWFFSNQPKTLKNTEMMKPRSVQETQARVCIGAIWRACADLRRKRAATGWNVRHKTRISWRNKMVLLCLIFFLIHRCFVCGLCVLKNPHRYITTSCRPPLPLIPFSSSLLCAAPSLSHHSGDHLRPLICPDRWPKRWV